MNPQVSNSVNEVIPSRAIPRREVVLALVPWGKSKFSYGDIIKLRPVSCRSRVYPEFMENKAFIVDKIKSKTVQPVCSCVSEDTNYHLTNCPKFSTHTQLIFLRYLGDNDHVVERDAGGRIINGRFDAGDFVLSGFPHVGM